MLFLCARLIEHSEFRGFQRRQIRYALTNIILLMIVLPPRALPALTVIVREFKFTCGTVGYAQLSVVNDMPVPIKPGTKTYEMRSVITGLDIV